MVHKNPQILRKVKNDFVRKGMRTQGLAIKDFSEAEWEQFSKAANNFRTEKDQ